MPVTTSVEDDVLVVTIDRTDRRNALDLPMWQQLRDAARTQGERVRAIVVTGAGPHFSAGMDLAPDNPVVARITPAMLGGDEHAANEVLIDLKECLQALADAPCPTFAAIEGACIGGGFEIALACDVRIAARDARIGLTEVHVGMIPDLGGCARLTRLVGPGRAADLIVTARRISGEEAFALGMVERVVPPGGALEAARAAAAEVCRNAPQAVRLALSTVRIAPDLGLDEALSVETRAGVLALTSGEPAEGVRAFLEKRPPRWS